MRYLKAILLLLLVTLAGNTFSLSFSVTTQQEATLPAVWSVCPQGPPLCQFSKIQEALTAANPGDLIQIQMGTYSETLVISKSLRLVGAGRDLVRLQGAEAGKPVITLQVEGELELLLDGLTIVGAPPASAEQPCFYAPLGPSSEFICPNGVEVRGQGALNLTLVDLQIVQAYGGIVCIGSAFEGSVVRLAVLRSRIADNQGAGIVFWACSQEDDSVITLTQTTISGNGSNGISVAEGEINITDSTFSSNRAAGVEAVGTMKIMLSHAWFVNNTLGININVSMRSLVELNQIMVMGNGTGVAFSGGGEESSFILQDSTLLDNGGLEAGAGLLLFLEKGTVEIRRNLIRRNQQGVVIRVAHRVEASNNRILENEGWGVALVLPPCFDVPLDGVPSGDLGLFIQGVDNEMSGNKRGDLCPSDYPWPPDFIKKP